MDQVGSIQRPHSLIKLHCLLACCLAVSTFFVVFTPSASAGSVVKPSMQEKAVPTARPALRSRVAVGRPAVVTPEDEEKDDEKEEGKKKAGEKSDDDNKPEHLKKKGPIQQVKKQLNKLCGLTWEGGQLTIRSPENYQAIDPIVDEIREKMGYGGGSSYGGDTYNFQFNSEKLNGRIAREKRDKKFQIILEASEVVKPFRSVQVKSTKEGPIQITVNSQETNYLLRIRQSENGTFVVQELDGVNVFASSASNFDSFCRKHPDFISERMLPTLEHFGLGSVMTPYDAKVQDKVAQLVSPWQEDEFDKVKKLTEQLNADTYQEREAAAEELTKSLADNKELLSRLIYDKRFSPEVRARTRLLIRAKLKEDKLAELDFIENVAKSLDVNYLIELIQRQTSPEARFALIEKLKDMSPELAELAEGGDGSVDVSELLVSQAVSAWASEQVSGKEDEPEVDVLQDKGPIDTAAPHTGQLVRLVWSKDHLIVDREHWKKPFNGKKIDELSKEVEKLVKEKNLPANWFNAGGASYSRSSAKHPQVLFEKMQEKLKSSKSSSQNYVRHYSNYNDYEGSGTHDRQFNLPKIDGRLSFSKSKSTRRRSSSSSSGGSLDKKPFTLMLHEKQDSLRKLTVEQPKDGEMRIQVLGDKSNYIVQLTVNENSALVQDIRGSRVQAYKAATFRQLMQDNPDYFRESFFPLLRKLGIEIDPEVDAGPSGNETTSLPKSSKSRLTAGS